MMSVNRMSGKLKYCEIPKINEIEVPSTIDKINIMYSTLVPSYLNILVVSNLY
jgi:hypothetical protein